MLNQSYVPLHNRRVEQRYGARCFPMTTLLVPCDPFYVISDDLIWRVRLRCASLAVTKFITVFLLIESESDSNCRREFIAVGLMVFVFSMSKPPTVKLP